MRARNTPVSLVPVSVTWKVLTRSDALRDHRISALRAPGDEHLRGRRVELLRDLLHLGVLRKHLLASH